MSAAFVWMYNHFSHPTYPNKEEFKIGFTEDVSRAYRALSMMVRSYGFEARGLSPLSYDEAYARVLVAEAHNNTANQILIAGTAGLLLAPVAEAGYVYVMTNPVKSYLFMDAALTANPTVSQMSTSTGQLGQAVGWIIRQLQ